MMDDCSLLTFFVRVVRSESNWPSLMLVPV